MQTEPYLDDVLRQLHKLKELADNALAQVTARDLFAVLDQESNSIAIIMKHLAGNMRSRWTGFLTSDGEKPDRNRDAEFEVADEDTKDSVLQRWEAGWRCVFDAITPLTPNDLSRTVFIRGEPHTVLEAIDRQMTHYAYHVGQIVLLAKHYAGDTWKSLSIPRGKSKEFEVSKKGTVYDVSTRLPVQKNGK